MRNRSEDHLSIALATCYLPEDLLLRHLTAFRQANCQITFTVTYEPVASIEAGLIADRLNFALVDRSLNEQFVHAHKFGDVPYVAVAAPGYIAARGPFERQENVLMGDLIVFDDDLGLIREWLSQADQAMHAMIEQIIPTFVVPSMTAARQLAIAGVGIAFLPRSTVADDLAAGRLQEICGRHPLPSRAVQLVYRRRNVRLLRESLLLEHLLEAGPVRG